MTARTVICFPAGEMPGLRAEAAQLALGLAACGTEVIALGSLGVWRHALRLAKITAVEFTLPGEERKLVQAIQEYEPHIIHAFGADAAHLALPLTVGIGAGGVATLGHGDLTHLNPAHFRTASTIFVPCAHLQEQVARRLPHLPVVVTGYLLPPAVDIPRNRFLAEELGVDDDAPVVLMADTFRGGEANVALALIDATPRIAERIPTVQVLIVGRGLRLGELESRALDINDRLGRRAVLLPGHRDDLPQLLALTTVAVGCGRFAQEAIGAGVSLVAAGAAGMIGAYTGDTAQITQFSCAGTHGHLDPVSPRLLAAEVIGLFTYSEFRRQFAEEGQRHLLAQAERVTRAAQIATYYQRTAPSGALTRTPQRITLILPDDLRELLFCLPALLGLRAQFPLAQYRYFTHPRHQRLLETLGCSPTLPRPLKFGDWITRFPQLWRPRAEIALAFSSHFRSSLLAGATLAPHRLGFSDGGGNLFLSDHLHPREPISPARALTLTQPFGASAGEIPVVTLPEDTQKSVNWLLEAQSGITENEPYILLCPRADPAFAWLPGAWTILISLLHAERPERLAVLEPENLALPQGVASIPAATESLQLAAQVARACLVIAPDNDVLHLADLLGTPAIGLFGPSSPDICRLPNSRLHPVCAGVLPCRPCTDHPCPERRCLRDLTPAAVMHVVNSLLPPVPLPVECSSEDEPLSLVNTSEESASNPA